jgi:hypothetical protein
MAASQVERSLTWQHKNRNGFSHLLSDSEDWPKAAAVKGAALARRLAAGLAGVRGAEPTDTSDKRALPATFLGSSGPSGGLGGFAAGRSHALA